MEQRVWQRRTVGRWRAPAAAGKARRQVAGGLAAAGSAPALALVAACASGGPAGGAPGRAGPVAVTYVSHLGETHPEGKGYLDLLEEYNRTNQEKITVKLEEARPAMGLRQDAGAVGRRARRRRRCPDRPTRSASLFVPGATVGHGGGAQARTRTGPGRRRTCSPGHLDNQMWGKLMSIATYQAVQGLVYSPKLLNRAGVPCRSRAGRGPTSARRRRKASKPPDTWGLSFAWIMHHLLSWMGTMGASYVSADKRKMTVNTRKCRRRPSSYSV